MFFHSLYYLSGWYCGKQKQQQCQHKDSLVKLSWENCVNPCEIARAHKIKVVKSLSITNPLFGQNDFCFYCVCFDESHLHKKLWFYISKERHDLTLAMYSYGQFRAYSHHYIHSMFKVHWDIIASKILVQVNIIMMDYMIFEVLMFKKLNFI
jgi:hypothetical protein